MQSTAGKSNSILIKKFGHNRSPSLIGGGGGSKTLPISTILSNYTQSSSNELKYNSIGRDGLSSPELDRPPLIFSIYEDDVDNCNDNINNQKINQNHSVNDDEHHQSVNKKLTNVKTNKTINFGIRKNTINDIEDLPIFILPNSNLSTNSLSSQSHSDIHQDNNLLIKKNVCQLFCENKNNCSKMINDNNNNKNDLLTIINNDDDNTNHDDIHNSHNDNNLPINDNEIQNNKNLLGIAEALVNTSMRTSPAARRRLIARKMEFELNSMNKNRNSTIDDTYIDDFNNSKHYKEGDRVEDDDDDIPSKELLIQLVRILNLKILCSQDDNT